MSLASYFNEKYTDFAALLLSPRNGAKRVVKKADFMAGVRQLAGIGFFTGLAAVLMVVVGWMLGGILQFSAGPVITALVSSIIVVAAYVLLFIPALVITVIAKAFWFGLMWALAKVLGGKGKFGNYFGAMTYPCLLVFMLSALSMALFSILASVINPFSAGAAGIVTIIGSLPAMLFALYGVWLLIAVTRESQQVGTARAAVAVVIPIVMMAVAAVITAFIVSFIASSLGSLLSL